MDAPPPSSSSSLVYTIYVRGDEFPSTTKFDFKQVTMVTPSHQLVVHVPAEKLSGASSVYVALVPTIGGE